MGNIIKDLFVFFISYRHRPTAPATIPASSVSWDVIKRVHGSFLHLLKSGKPAKFFDQLVIHGRVFLSHILQIQVEVIGSVPKGFVLVENVIHDSFLLSYLRRNTGNTDNRRYSLALL